MHPLLVRVGRVAGLYLTCELALALVGGRAIGGVAPTSAALVVGALAGTWLSARFLPRHPLAMRLVLPALGLVVLASSKLAWGWSLRGPSYGAHMALQLSLAGGVLRALPRPPTGLRGAVAGMLAVLGVRVLEVLVLELTRYGDSPIRWGHVFDVTGRFPWLLLGALAAPDPEYELVGDPLDVRRSLARWARNFALAGLGLGVFGWIGCRRSMDPSMLPDLSGLLVIQDAVTILACGALLGAVRGLIYLADRSRWLALGALAALAVAYGLQQHQDVLRRGEHMRRLETEAARGDTSAMLELARNYDGGYWTAKDPVKSAQWYQKLADLGDMAGITNMEYAYRVGQGVPRDDVKATQYLLLMEKRAGPDTSHLLWVNLGDVYMAGRGVKQDRGRALAYYEKLKDYREYDARMGDAYLNGWGVPADPARAAQHYLKAANADQVECNNALGVMYHQGRGVSRDDREAVRWFRKGWHRLEPDAMHNLLWMSEHGLAPDLTVDELRELRLYIESAGPAPSYDLRPRWDSRLQ